MQEKQLPEILKSLLVRDLRKLKEEISLYQMESRLWIIDGRINNSAGNLCLHLVGNLKAYIGAELGNSGYIRQRDKEFSEKDIPRKQLENMIDETIAMVEKTMDTLTPEILEQQYPLPVFNTRLSTRHFLVHLATHLSYHLGQVNYHRRLLDP